VALTLRHEIRRSSASCGCRRRRLDELRRQHGGRLGKAGVYAGQILKGAKPANLPVIRSDKVELTIT